VSAIYQGSNPSLRESKRKFEIMYSNCLRRLRLRLLQKLRRNYKTTFKLITAFKLAPDWTPFRIEPPLRNVFLQLFARLNVTLTWKVRAGRIQIRQLVPHFDIENVIYCLGLTETTDNVLQYPLSNGYRECIGKVRSY
jgi:hypothetical protein